MTITACSNNNFENEHNSNNIEDEVKNMSIEIEIGEKSFTATLENNETAKAFKKLLPLTINMNDVNGNEKYATLSKNIDKDSANNQGNIKIGDIMCWGSNGLVLFYKNFSTSYSYIKIGTVDNIDGYAEALAKGSVQVKFK